MRLVTRLSAAWRALAHPTVLLQAMNQDEPVVALRRDLGIAQPGYWAYVRQYGTIATAALRDLCSEMNKPHHA